jgi:tetratricopeptide (TPR) repeat protein
MARSHAIRGAETGLLGMLLVLAGGTMPAETPAEKIAASRPPWQRLLQGADAKQAAELQGRVTQQQQAGRWAEALRAADELLELRQRAQGKDHWEAVDAHWQGQALRAAQRQGKELQKEYAELPGLQRQAFALVAKGRYWEAQPLLDRTLDINRKVLGEEHPDTATSYDNVAFILNAQGQYAAAEERSRKALDIFRKLLGEEHPATARSFNNVAGNLRDQGKYAAAGEGYRKALEIWRKVLGEEDPDTARSYGNVAFNLYAQGKYAEAEEGFRKALDIHRKVLGEEHSDTATGYNNLALNLNAQGKYAAAGEGFRKALAIRRKVQGEEHPLTAQSYNNLAFNLQAQGNYAAAEVPLRKALDIRIKLLGEEHPLTASSYNNVAANLDAQGKYAQAEEGYRKALDIWRKVLGEEHPHTAISYGSVAGNLQDQGMYAAAEEGYRKALDIRRKVLSEEHPDTARSYSNLARNLHAQGKYAQAETLWLRAADTFAKARPRITHSGLERATVTGERSPLPALAAVLARNGKPALAWQRFEESLARGTWDDLSARLRRPAAGQARQAALVGQLDRLDQLIEKAVAIKDETPQQKQQREDLLGQRRKAQEELDSFVAHLEKTYGPAAGQVFEIPRIQAALADDTALVGWIDRKPAGPNAADPNGEHWAFLLRSKGHPVCVRLGGSGANGAWTEQDSNLPTDLRTALREHRPGWQRLAQQLYLQRLAPLAKHLAAGAGLPAVRRLLVLPSAGLRGVPVELFAGDLTVSYALSGTLHAHLHSLSKLSAEGLLALADPAFELPARREEPPPLPERGVLLTAVLPGSNAARARLRPGDVLLQYHDMDLNGLEDFKPLPESEEADKEVAVTAWRAGKTFQTRLRPGKLGVVLAKDPAPKALAQLREQDRRLAALRDEPWARLPGTRIEAEALQRLFESTPAKAEVLLGSQASEQRLDELARSGALAKYRYLHLATHGEVDDRWPLRSAVLLARDQLPDAGKQLDAGLPVYDAKLTAAEVLQSWNLHCELVTLSACQSALGRYEHGEGFVGFAQAFVLAGSRSVCLSLWPVDDAATALLMQRFYANLLGQREGLKAPLGKAAALAEAKAWLRDLSGEEALALTASLRQGVVRKKDAPAREGPGGEKPAFAKGAKPYAHPYYWSAFVLIGDPE